MHITACLTAAGPEHSGTIVSDRWKRESESDKAKGEISEIVRKRKGKVSEEGSARARIRDAT